MFVFFRTCVPFSSVLCKFGKFSSEVPIKSLLSCSDTAAKAITACRYKRLIKYAARANGPFPEYNKKLATYIEEAKKCGISEETIQFSINITLDVRALVGLHEIAFPGKGLIVAQYEGINFPTISQEIMKACEEYDATFLVDSQRQQYFDTEGVIVVTDKTEGGLLNGVDQEKLSTIGVQRVSFQADHDDDGKKMIILHCDVNHLHQVKRNVTDMNYVIEEAYVGLVPKKFAKLSDKAVEKVADLMFELSQIQEIDRLYENVQ